MGLWGIFFGPIIASVLYALVQIFKSELDLLNAEPKLAKPAVAVALPIVTPVVAAKPDPVAPVQEPSNK
jgi:hypothetical protein